MALSAGEHVLVCLKKDEAQWRHYVIVSDAAAQIYHWCLTPSRYTKRVDFSDANVSDIQLFIPGKLPKGVRRSDVLLDIDSAKGAYLDWEIAAATKLAEKAVGSFPLRAKDKAVVDQKSLADAPEDVADDLEVGVADARGVAPVRRFKGKRPVRDDGRPGSPCEDGGSNDEAAVEKDPGKLAPKGLWARKLALSGEIWICVCEGGVYKVGTEVDLDEVEHKVLGRHAVFKAGRSAEGVAVRCKAGEAPKALRDHQVRSSGHGEDRFAKVTDIYHDPAAKPSSEAKVEEEDVRVLSIALDGAHERFVSMVDAVTLYTEEEMVDWPIDGHRTGLFTTRRLRRSSMTFMQQHEAWKKSSHIRSTDRAIHEHFALSRALHFAQYYDQLNVPNIACCEALIKRRQLIERAYRLGAPDAPNFSGSDHFQGVRETADGTVIDPALNRYTGDRLHAEYEVERNSRLAITERQRRTGAAEGDDFVPPVLPKKHPKGGRPNAGGDQGKGGEKA